MIRRRKPIARRRGVLRHDVRRLPKLERALLLVIRKGGGVELRSALWPVAERLARKGFITLGAPHGRWRRADPVDLRGRP